MRHASRTAATIARTKVDQKGKGKLLCVYHCPTCKGWHLGNNWETRIENINRIFDRLPPSDRASAQP